MKKNWKVIGQNPLWAEQISSLRLEPVGNSVMLPVGAT